MMVQIISEHPVLTWWFIGILLNGISLFLLTDKQKGELEESLSEIERIAGQGGRSMAILLAFIISGFTWPYFFVRLFTDKDKP